MCDGIGTVGLDLVVDHDMTGILTIDGYVDDSSHMVAVVPLGTNGIHHLRVSYAYYFLTHFGTDTVTGNLLHIRDLTTVCRLVREGVAQGGTDGVGGEVLHMGCQV